MIMIGKFADVAPWADWWFMIRMYEWTCETLPSCICHRSKNYELGAGKLFLVVLFCCGLDSSVFEYKYNSRYTFLAPSLFTASVVFPNSNYIVLVSSCCRSTSFFCFFVGEFFRKFNLWEPPSLYVQAYRKQVPARMSAKSKYMYLRFLNSAMYPL